MCLRFQDRRGEVLRTAFSGLIKDLNETSVVHRMRLQLVADLFQKMFAQVARVVQTCIYV